MNKVNELLDNNMGFAISFAKALATHFKDFDEILKGEILNLLEERNILSIGFCTGLVPYFHLIDEKSKARIIRLIKEIDIYAVSFASAAGMYGAPLGEVKELLVSLMSKRYDIIVFFTYGMAMKLQSFNKDERKAIYELSHEFSENISNFAYTFGSAIGRGFNTFTKETQNEILEQAKRDELFARGLEDKMNVKDEITQSLFKQ